MLVNFAGQGEGRLPNSSPISCASNKWRRTVVVIIVVKSLFHDGDHVTFIA